MWEQSYSASVWRQFLPQSLPNAGTPLTLVIEVAASVPDHRMIPDGSPPIFVPLSLDPAPPIDQGVNNEDSHTDDDRNSDYGTDPETAAYGAQLVKRIAQERIEVSRLMAEERDKPTDEGQLEIQRSIIRLKSLYEAAWALYMIGIAHDPKVWRLLTHNKRQLNQPGADTMNTFLKAQEAIVSGDTTSLEAHVKNVIEENARLGRPTRRPVSELGRFMEQAPAGSAVLSRLRLLQRIASEDTEESRLFVEGIMYGLWWVLERKAEEFDRAASKYGTPTTSQ